MHTYYTTSEFGFLSSRDSTLFTTNQIAEQREELSFCGEIQQVQQLVLLLKQLAAAAEMLSKAKTQTRYVATHITHTTAVFTFTTHVSCLLYIFSAGNREFVFVCRLLLAAVCCRCCPCHFLH